MRRFLSSLLFGIVSMDLFMMVGAAALLVSVAMIASTIPARRATKVDPVTVLRYE